MSGEHAFFWSGVVIALFPVLVFGGLGVVAFVLYLRSQKRRGSDDRGSDRRPASTSP